MTALLLHFSVIDGVFLSKTVDIAIDKSCDDCAKDKKQLRNNNKIAKMGFIMIIF